MDSTLISSSQSNSQNSEILLSSKPSLSDSTKTGCSKSKQDSVSASEIDAPKCCMYLDRDSFNSQEMNESDTKFAQHSEANNLNVCALLQQRQSGYSKSASLDFVRMHQRTHLQKNDCTANLLNQSVIPNQMTYQHQISKSRLFNGKFSKDGSMFYGSSQGQIGVFNSTGSDDPKHIVDWKNGKYTEAKDIQWTVTDVDLDPNNQFLIYSSITPTVKKVDLKTNETHAFNMSQSLFDGEQQSCLRRSNFMYNKQFLGIWSLSLVPGCSNQFLTGTNRGILMYDMETQKMLMKQFQAHQDDINAIKFLKDDDKNVFVTGADDGYIKLWDARKMCRPQGGFIGHSEGITSISTKSNGLQFASNSKDQQLKVWDIRKMRSLKDFTRACSYTEGRIQNFDYRWGDYPLRGKQIKQKGDNSMMTFTGHYVLDTLVRCSWSPPFTTGERYISTGSACGSVFIFDTITGQIHSILQKKKDPSSNPDSESSPPPQESSSQLICRDISWHPRMHTIVTTHFSGVYREWSYSPQNEYQLDDSESKPINTPDFFDDSNLTKIEEEEEEEEVIC